MPTDVIMPQMGESIFEGTITKWLKKAGDRVEKDEPLFEISTDKVDAEIPSPVAGVLSEIKVGEGATVEINTVVGVVTEAGEAVAPQVAAAGPVIGGTDVVMPQMGESIFEGTITKWLKKAGDTVEKDEPLFEISTDKVDAEIPAPVAGVLTEIKFQEGATVEINTVVAVIGGSAAAVSRSPLTPAAKIAPALLEQAPAVSSSPGERIRSSPLVRKMAQENNLDLAEIAGTGAGGRICKEDVVRHLSAHGPGSAAPKSAAPSSAAATQATAIPAASGQAFAELRGQRVPLSKMRAIIAQRMVESVATSPHVYTVYKVDMTTVARIRARDKSRFEQKHGVKLTFMPFIAVAAVEALRRFPIVNASSRRWRDPLPHQHQPGHCRGAGVGPDCAGDQAGRGAQLRGDCQAR